MTQKYTILFDLDGTLVDTAPDLMNAHNHVMKKYGYPTKSTEEIRNLVGQGAGAMLGRSIWGQAKKEFSKVQDEIDSIDQAILTIDTEFQAYAEELQAQLNQRQTKVDEEKSSLRIRIIELSGVKKYLSNELF